MPSLENMNIKPRVILDYVDSGDAYSDGDELENELLKIFSSNEPEKRIEEILRNEPSWPQLYHLSPVRRNLLDWFPFSPKAGLLEVGAGMGALTGMFCEKAGEVTAIELTERRARVTAARNRERENLTVIAGNVFNIRLKDKYDYVTSIGVLEYAGKYSDHDNPFAVFLQRLHSLLKRGGELILAIENKYGLKYWSGAREDHTGRLFDSLEGYPGRTGVRTFGKVELQGLLAEAGFRNIKFFYPLPDYKLPTEIFSDDYLPSATHNVRTDIIPYADYSRPREYLFNERLVSDSLMEDSSFPFFANSFLVIAGS